jgi:hypothetical protein
VEEGGASVDIRDDNGRTVIDWFIQYISENISKMLGVFFEKKCEANIKYLQEKRKVSSNVWQNIDS